MLACAILACLIYLPGLGRPALFEPDEGRYAEIGREMLISGDYVTPRDDWVRYFEKPPLVYWATAGMIRLMGPSELAVRLPVALCSVGEVVVTMLLAEAMFGVPAGLWAALCLALSPLVFGFGRFLTLDPPLAFFITATLASFWFAASDLRSARGRRWLYLGAVLVALGTLTKGPVALVLAGAIAVLYLLIEGRWRDLGAIPWLRWFTIYLLITVPWFVLVEYRNPGFLRYFFVHEHVERYTESKEHAQGVYFFAVVVLGGMWPWIGFVPAALAELRRKAVSTMRPALIFCILWFGVIFVFFSIPVSKLGSYILPALPALAILAGYGIQRLAESGADHARRLFAAVAAIDVALAVAAFFVAPRLKVLRPYPALQNDLLIGLGGLAAGSLAAALLSRKRLTRTAVCALAAGVLIGLGAMVKARRDGGPLDSYRELSRQISAVIRPGCVLASYRHDVKALPFYTGVREALVSYRGELAPFSHTPDAQASFIPSDQALRELWGSGRCVVLVINRRDLPRVVPTLSPAAHQIGREGKKFALTNQSVAEARKNSSAGLEKLSNSIKK